MVLKPKGEPNTDGLENRIEIKGVSYTCNENHKKENVHIEIDMPPAYPSGHLVSSCVYYTYISKPTQIKKTAKQNINS